MYNLVGCSLIFAVLYLGYERCEKYDWYEFKGAAQSKGLFTGRSSGKYVFGIVKVGERGQIVIPKHARDVFDIKPGDKLLVVGDIKRGLGIGKVSRSIASDFVFEE